MFLNKDQTINYGSWADRFSSTWTFLFLMVLAAITGLRHYLGPNAVCNTPNHFNQAAKKYAEEHCWMSRQRIEENEPVFKDEEDLYRVSFDVNPSSTENIRTLYQWLPLILACQALLFRLPHIILATCESTFCLGSQKVIAMVQHYGTLSHHDRTKVSTDIGAYLYQEFKSRFIPAIPFGIITLILAFTKTLYFINAVTQLTILEGYLSPANHTNVTSYGEYVLNSVISTNYTEIAYSPAFPREVMCDLEFLMLSNKQRFSVQCVVPVNEFNEKLCFFVWIWLLFVCVVAGTSGLIFLAKALLPMVRKSYVNKYLSMAKLDTNPYDVGKLSGSLIGQDGVYILKIIGEFSSDILVRDIVVHLWNEEQNRDHSERTTRMQQQQGIPLAGMAGASSSGADQINPISTKPSAPESGLLQKV